MKLQHVSDAARKRLFELANDYRDANPRASRESAKMRLKQPAGPQTSNWHEGATNGVGNE